MTSKELSFGYIKSEGIDNACETEVRQQIKLHDLELLWTRDVFMDYLRLREHQPILFDIKGDLNDIWKIQGAARLIGTTVRTIGVVGVEAVNALMDINLFVTSLHYPANLIEKGRLATPTICTQQTIWSRLSKMLRY